MIDKVAFKVAASTLMLGVTMVGCTASADMVRPHAASTKAAKTGAVEYHAHAEAALRERDFARALTLTEKAVELSPRDVGYRMLLADLYIRNGRFASAEATFADVIALNPGNERATIHLVLTQIAQGKAGSALATLDGAAGETADIGLAYALAGETRRAIDILEGAARLEGADGRVRQNLALAYALSGDWQKARVTAAQDVSPADLDSRMEDWAAFAQPSSSYDQVATLLGVTPAADAGQPTRLALAPAVPDTAFAAAEAPVVVDPAIVSGSSVTIDLPPPVAVAAVEIPAPAAPPAPVIEAPALTFAAVVESLTDSPPPVIRASAPVADAPLPAFAPAVKRSAKKVRPGRFVVQIGAFSSPVLVEKAWSQAQKRYGFGDDSVPLSTTVKVGGGKMILHRLSVAGFDSHSDANRFCQGIKVKRGVCFVRANAGDAPVQWASSAVSRKA